MVFNVMSHSSMSGYRAGSHRIHADAERSELNSERAGERRDGALDGGVVGSVRIALIGGGELKFTRLAGRDLSRWARRAVGADDPGAAAAHHDATGGWWVTWAR